MTTRDGSSRTTEYESYDPRAGHVVCRAPDGSSWRVVHPSGKIVHRGSEQSCRDRAEWLNVVAPTRREHEGF